MKATPCTMAKPNARLAVASKPPGHVQGPGRQQPPCSQKAHVAVACINQLLLHLATCMCLLAQTTQASPSASMCAWWRISTSSPICARWAFQPPHPCQTLSGLQPGTHQSFDEALTPWQPPKQHPSPLPLHSITIITTCPQLDAPSAPDPHHTRASSNAPALGFHPKPFNTLDLLVGALDVDGVGPSPSTP